MASREIEYFPKTKDETLLAKHQRSNSLGTVYLKATIILLSILLFAVSVVLVWQLVSNDKPNCDCKHKYKEAFRVSPAEKFSSAGCQITMSPDKPLVFPRRGQKILEKTAKYLRQYVNNKDLVSFSASAFYDEETVWKTGHGVLNRNTFPSEMPDEHTIYHVGSIAKILTVFITFKLLNKKKISCLDDPIDRYAKNFAIKNPFNDDKITIRHILSHTSGLPREVPCGPSFSSESEDICPVNTTYVYRQLQITELKFPPGTAVGYSNLAYALLAHVLYEKFGFGYSSWESWITREILDPINMTLNTHFDNPRYLHNIATNYKDNGIKTPNLNWGWSASAIQMSTSTFELTKLLSLLIGKSSSLFHRNEIQEMFRPVFTFPNSNEAFSSGWLVDNHNSLRVIKASGAVPGSSAAVFLIPEIKFGFVLLATGREIAPRLAGDIIRNFTKGIISSITPKRMITNPTRPTKYTGKYILLNKWSDQVHATISFSNYRRRLILRQKPGYPRTAYLNFIKTGVLQIIYPRGLSCTTYALGQDREVLRFGNPDATGRWRQFSLGSFLFKRIG